MNSKFDYFNKFLFLNRKMSFVNFSFIKMYYKKKMDVIIEYIKRKLYGEEYCIWIVNVWCIYLL